MISAFRIARPLALKHNAMPKPSLLKLPRSAADILYGHSRLFRFNLNGENERQRLTSVL